MKHPTLSTIMKCSAILKHLSGLVALKGLGFHGRRQTSFRDSESLFDFYLWIAASHYCSTDSFRVLALKERVFWPKRLPSFWTNGMWGLLPFALIFSCAVLNIFTSSNINKVATETLSESRWIHCSLTVNLVSFLWEKSSAVKYLDRFSLIGEKQGTTHSLTGHPFLLLNDELQGTHESGHRIHVANGCKLPMEHKCA